MNSTSRGRLAGQLGKKGQSRGMALMSLSPTEVRKKKRGELLSFPPRGRRESHQYSSPPAFPPKKEVEGICHFLQWGEEGHFPPQVSFQIRSRMRSFFFSFPNCCVPWESNSGGKKRLNLPPLSSIHLSVLFPLFSIARHFSHFLFAQPGKKYIYGVFLLALNLRSVLIIKRTYKRFQSRRRRCRCHPGYLTLDLIREAE